MIYKNNDKGYIDVLDGVKRKITMNIEGEQHLFLPGNSWSIPGDVEHGAEILEDSVVVEVFSPVREDYLPRLP